jgi:hypothetical protein
MFHAISYYRSHRGRYQGSLYHTCKVGYGIYLIVTDLLSVFFLSALVSILLTVEG